MYIIYWVFYIIIIVIHITTIVLIIVQTFMINIIKIIIGILFIYASQVIRPSLYHSIASILKANELELLSTTKSYFAGYGEVKHSLNNNTPYLIKLEYSLSTVNLFLSLQ